MLHPTPINKFIFSLLTTCLHGRGSARGS